MKKKIYSLLMLAMAAFAFTSCEDVPMPYDMPGSASESDEPLVQVVGDGTVENPYNVAGALYLITEGKTTDEVVAVEGIISQIDEIDTGSFGNATYYISDDGTTAKQLQVYRGYYLNGDRFKDKAAIKVGDKVIVSGQLTYHNQKTPEFAQGSSIYSLNGQGGGSQPAGEAKGTGTKDDPFNVAGAIAKCKEIGSNPSTEKYYVKGTAVDGATADDSFNNITFDIADTEGGAKFKCFQVKGTDGKPLPSGFAIKKGDEVVVYGPMYNYKGNTPETEGKSAAYIVTVNGKATGEGGGGNTPQPSNTSTIDNPYTVAKALDTANALSDNETTTEEFYIKGKVSRKANTADEIGPNSSKKYKDMNYYISDDGTQSKELYIYRGKYLDGADFTDFEQLKENDEVVVVGKLQKYIDTKNGNAVVLELKESKIVKLNGQSGSGEQGGGGNNGPGTVSGNTITVKAIDFGVANGKTMDTQTLADGTKLVFDGGGNSNAPKYYDTGTNIRMYPKNSVTITASKNIQKVVFTCDEYQGTTYNASGDITAQPGTANLDGKNVTISNISSKTTTITNTSGNTGATSQIRIVSIEITYDN
jgi:hypothetical protein